MRHRDTTTSHTRLGSLGHKTIRELDFVSACMGRLKLRLRARIGHGGHAAWFDAGLASEAGITRMTSTLDDIWYKPHQHGADHEEQARACLTWGVALVEQIARGPTIRFHADA